jgi:hypothetical protein
MYAPGAQKNCVDNGLEIAPGDFDKHRAQDQEDAAIVVFVVTNIDYLPKTRSGKIMRRILRKIAANEHDQLGDTSTLADPAVTNDLVNNRMNGSDR